MLDNQTIGWGRTSKEGAEIWDANPVFGGESVTFRDKLKLLFYPKKFFLYGWLNKNLKKRSRFLPLGKGESEGVDKGQINQPPPAPPFQGGEYIRILDVGCGTGASVIDFKKMFGRAVEVVGVDVVKMQIDIAREKIKKHAVWAEAQWYDGGWLPFKNGSFDAVYSSDVLGHVKDVKGWLEEINRVLKPGGTFAMFAESKLGRHAYIRNYLLKRGLNIDPHADFHISLYSKSELKKMLSDIGFEIKKMYGAFWAGFFVHPDEYAHKLRSTNQHKFPILRFVNHVLYWIKKKLHPYSTALCELYGLIEMLTVGRWIEAQGYAILAKKR